MKTNTNTTTNGNKTLNELDYGCAPADMGTSGLVVYVRGHFWPFVPESTCFHARTELAESIINNRSGERGVQAFRKAIFAGRGQ